LDSSHLFPLSQGSLSCTACCAVSKAINVSILFSLLVVYGGKVSLDSVALSWPEAEILRPDSDKEIMVREGMPKS